MGIPCKVTGKENSWKIPKRSDRNAGIIAMKGYIHENKTIQESVTPVWSFALGIQ